MTLYSILLNCNHLIFQDKRFEFGNGEDQPPTTFKWADSVFELNNALAAKMPKSTQWYTNDKLHNYKIYEKNHLKNLYSELRNINLVLYRKQHLWMKLWCRVNLSFFPFELLGGAEAAVGPWEDSSGSGTKVLELVSHWNLASLHHVPCGGALGGTAGKGLEPVVEG